MTLIVAACVSTPATISFADKLFGWISISKGMAASKAMAMGIIEKNINARASLFGIILPPLGGGAWSISGAFTS